MAAPAIVKTGYADLFGTAMLPVLEELFANEVERHPSVRDSIFDVKTTDRDIWQSSEILDLPTFGTVAEGADYTFSAPAAGNKKTLSMVKYGRGFSISEEMCDDGRFDSIAMMVRKLAEAGRETQEVSAMNIFNNGFSTETAWDALSVFNALHVQGVTTYRNKPAVAADLSESSLQTALSDFDQIFVGDTGIIKKYKPRVLLVPSSLKRYAMELVGSELKPDTANNNMNSLRSDSLQVVASPHLTDSDAWFILADAPQTGLKLVKRKPLETVAGGGDVGFINDSILYKARYREKIGVTHAQGIYGNAGA